MGLLHGAPRIILVHPSRPFDHSFYMRILRLCIARNAFSCGRQIHGHVITSGFSSNVHLSTKLLVFYAKCMELRSARKVFDEMRERNVVSWSAMVSGCCQNGHFEDALTTFVEMRREGVKANQFTYGSVLRACTSSRCFNAGVQVQGCVEKGRLVGNLFVQSALIDFHSKCGQMEDADRLFERMTDRDIVSWNTMIGGYAVHGLVANSFQLFCLMMREGMAPDCFTLGSVLQACAAGGALLQVSQVHKFIVEWGFLYYKDLTGSLIDAYAKCGSVQTAHHLYRSMSEKDLISYTALVNAYARKGKYGNDFLDILKELACMQLEVDDITLCSILHICADIASLILGRQIHVLVLKRLASKDVAIGNALVDMYGKCGEIKDATHAFVEMQVKNVISWTSLIAAYGRHGFGDEAVALYRQMENKGLKPNDVTFLSLLFACSHSGLTGDGWHCFTNMISKYGIVPRAEHFSCLVDLSARSGQLEEAYKMIQEMDIKPNASLWASIVGACRIYGNTSLGKIAARHLVSLYPKNCTNYVLLASVYAETGAWECAQDTWSCMDKMGLKKDPGYSLLVPTKKRIALLQHC
ncbi:pentatricopeptide repeat-containing protein At3g20730 [Rhodamnia argentea]|uniref:Pentatricopeptide repeat-containing protein At3g20730 n=1 Tax=Rhodamnia argentea TaxID=178133 RepID=A0A8B8P3Y6_9MYRT|nr:pentatricopeptide repeat-containing protein At3g20730 [Rhodamnia argentea]